MTSQTPDPAPLPLPEPPQEAKQPQKSLTAWGIALTILGGLGGLAETVVPQYYPPGTTHSIYALGAILVGGALALYGRVRAKGPLTLSAGG